MEPLAFCFIVFHQCAEIVVHFQQHIHHTAVLIRPLLGVVTLNRLVQMREKSLFQFVLEG